VRSTTAESLPHSLKARRIASAVGSSTANIQRSLVCTGTRTFAGVVRLGPWRVGDEWALAAGAEGKGMNHARVDEALDKLNCEFKG
jgi:hypothetical protein